MCSCVTLEPGCVNTVVIAIALLGRNESRAADQPGIRGTVTRTFTPRGEEVIDGTGCSGKGCFIRLLFHSRSCQPGI